VDSAGLVKLVCEDKDAQIRYTIDGTIPNPYEGKIYESPITLTYPVTILMQAFAPEKTASRMVSEIVGIHVYQPAQRTNGNMEKGLIYRYYEGEVRSTDQIEKNHLVKTGIKPKFTIGKSPRDQNFAFIFEGYIKIPEDGLYTFFLESNDGSILLLNDHLLIDNDGSHGVYEKKSSTSLQSGMHKIKVKFFQLGGSSQLKIRWKGPGIPMQEIPAAVLYHITH
jgi:hypothetical protein